MTRNDEAKQSHSRSERSRCPTCGSTIKSVHRRPCDTENNAADPWHEAESPVAPTPHDIHNEACGCFKMPDPVTVYIPPAETSHPTEEAGWPECEEFYNLMQQYRHAPIDNQLEVVAAYEAVKSWLVRNRAIAKQP